MTAFKNLMWLCVGLSFGSVITYSIIEWQRQPTFTYIGAAESFVEPKIPKAKPVTEGEKIIARIIKTPTMQEFLSWAKGKHYEYTIKVDLKPDTTGLPDTLPLKKVKWPFWLVKVYYIVAKPKAGADKENLIHIFYVEQGSGKIVRER